ncbi:sensor histidine kinase [Gorillibacterium massiliense]|uniref:sensor histidine kinase n=1 Tax=Gorillibacterium massiliense TaxID=1280390 RepID=UPI000592A978|nr:histidine kinase [Gorillibacterium massiliense]
METSGKRENAVGKGKGTLRSRTIIGFAIITLPLLGLLTWNNLYAKEVVHTQAVTSNKNLLLMYMNQIDQTLNDLNLYLLKSVSQDDDLIPLNALSNEDPDAYIAKIRTMNNLYFNLNYYKTVDALFAYNGKNNELLFTPQQSLSFERRDSIRNKLALLLHDKTEPDLFKTWKLIHLDDQYALVRIIDTGYLSYMGAWVDINKLMVPLNLLHLGNDGEALFLSKNGTPLTPPSDSNLTADLKTIDWDRAMANQTDKPYRILNRKQKLLLVIQPSGVTDLRLAVIIPEKNLMEGLTLFQRVNLYLPILVALILVAYLLFLQRYIHKPLTQLVNGMRRIYSGDLSARFKDDGLQEFMVIGETFNKMARQIEVLKIDIYEEQIRTQRAELKHLQAQIHPHFFMNSLNIVYSLAETRNYELIQQLSVHLVKYFRSSIRTHLSSVTLTEELEHVYSYLSIQKMRFPEALTFSIEMDQEAGDCQIPPSTIQPLVENAIIHGFSIRPNAPFHICIRAAVEESVPDKLFLEVRDNGKGFSPEKLALMESIITEEEPIGNHIGLWNVLRRCRLFYKEQVEIDFINDKEQGGVVVLRVPRQTRNEERDGVVQSAVG